MDSAQADLNALVERLRIEIRRRKLELEQKARSSIESAVESSPILAAPQATGAAERPPLAIDAGVGGKQPLKRAQSALDRALTKNHGAQSWPRFLRGLRRNQETINESMLQAIQVLLAICTSLEKRINDHIVHREEQGRRLIQLEEWVHAHAQQAAGEEAQSKRQETQLRDLERKLVHRARQATEQEERIEHQRHQIDELRRNAGLLDGRSGDREQPGGRSPTPGLEAVEQARKRP